MHDDGGVRSRATAETMTPWQGPGSVSCAVSETVWPWAAAAGRVGVAEGRTAGPAVAVGVTVGVAVAVGVPVAVAVGVGVCL